MQSPVWGRTNTKPVCVALLRACAMQKDLNKGTRVHADILKWGLLQTSSYVANTLVSMYAKCGALAKAELVVDELPVRNVVCWSALIAGYAQHGRGEDALNCFNRMQGEGLFPNEVTFICILKACGSIGAADKGKQIHDEIVRQGLLRNNIVLGTALVDMYAKCGALMKAQQVFEELPIRDEIAWNALITGYTQQGQGQDALNCFYLMQGEGLLPNAVTFICILKACGSIGAADEGGKIHDEIAKQGLLGKDIVLGNALVDMYVKCGALAKARQVLEDLPFANVVPWNALVAGYIQQAQGQDALNCFEQMKRKGVAPDKVTLCCILKACGSIGAADMGEQIHNDIVRHGLLGNNIVLGTALVDMYAKCGVLAKAQLVLNELPARDVVSWNVLIAGYTKQGQAQDALASFERMQREGLAPNVVTFNCLLKACGSIGAADLGEHIHNEIAKQGLLLNDIMLGTALVEMYIKCGALVQGRRVLEELPVRNVGLWNALLAGYTQEGRGQEAIDCFEQMQNKGLSPDKVTFGCVLKACGSTGAAEKGGQIHDEIVRQGLLENNTVLGIALVDMYAKCGALAKARQVLEELPVGNVAPWNALIAGYAQQGQGHDALSCFEQMQRKGLFPDIITFTCVLKACASIGAANKGEQIHDEIVRHGLLGNDIVLGTALLDMYAKCGALAKAQKVLEDLPVGNVFSWNALIAAYAQQGQGQDALNCFEWMQCKGLSPDAITFVCVLNACSHSGLVDEGQICFANMSNIYSITPNLEHYTCMVDLFGRAGHVDKAVAMIKKMPSSDYPAVWSALLGACCKWGDVSIGKWAFEHAVQVDKSDVGIYVCMANILTAAGMQEEAQIIEASRVRNRAWKKPGCSCWNGVSGNVLSFLDGVTKHTQSGSIYAKLEDTYYMS